MQNQMASSFVVSKRAMSLVLQRLRTKVTVHVGKHVALELLFLALATTPLAIIVAVVSGLAGWLLGGWADGLWTAAIAGMTILVLAPLYIRLSCGPDTRIDCAECFRRKSSPVHHRLERNGTWDQRKHPRYQVDLSGTFSGDHRTGSAVVKDLSAGGCRLMSHVPIERDERIELRINLPSRDAPLKVARAIVRWCRGDTVGVEFLGMEREDRDALSHLMSTFGLHASGEARPVFG